METAYYVWDASIDAYRLKLMALMFDRVYFRTYESHYVPRYSHSVRTYNDDLVDSVLQTCGCPASEKAGNTLRRMWYDSTSVGAPAVSYNEERDAWKHAPEWMTKLVAKTAAEEFEARGMIDTSGLKNEIVRISSARALHDLHYWREYFPDAKLASYPVLERFFEYGSGPRFTTGLRRLPFPDVSSLDWDDICELRKSPHLEPFRRWISTSDGSVQMMEKDYLESLEILIDEISPNFVGEIRKAIICNIPFPFPNPFALLQSAKDIYAAREVSKKFGWALFLRQMDRFSRNS